MDTHTTAWAHLPNAAHIDAVLADVEARPEVWAAAWDAVETTLRRAAGDAAWFAAGGSVGNEALHATWCAVRQITRAPAWSEARNEAWSVASDAMDALIAWDSSADLLDLSPDALRTLVDIAPAPVCHQATLLLPWAIVREQQP